MHAATAAHRLPYRAAAFDRLSLLCPLPTSTSLVLRGGTTVATFGGVRRRSTPLKHHVISDTSRRLYSTPSTSTHHSPSDPTQVSDSDSVLIGSSYFPYGCRVPTRFPVLRGSPLCRLGFGGTPRPGTNIADAAGSVKTYARLGGNFIDLPRGLSLDMIASFKELIEDNPIPQDLIIASAVSSFDLLAFVSGERARWVRQERRRLMAAPDESLFVSQLVPAGVAAPKTPRDLLPLLPQILSSYVRWYLDSHELESLDLLLFEPPPINLHPETVPDSSFDWLGGVTNDFLTSDEFVSLLRVWFESLEREVHSGRIRSYGLHSARITYSQKETHMHRFYVPVERVIEAAKESALCVHTAAGVASDPAAASPEHHLSALRFPFSLFSAHHILYSSSLLRACRAHSLLALGDSPFDDSEPTHREWVRFQEVESAIGVRDANKIGPRYREAMANVTAIEAAYKKLVESTSLSDSSRADLPPRLPHASWAHLLAAHQSELHNIVTWQQLFYGRIRPSISGPLTHLKGHLNRRVSEWSRLYLREVQSLFKIFQHAVERSTDARNERLNQIIVDACPRMAAFPSLDEKAILILMSTDIDVLLTDQIDSFDRLARTLVEKYNQQSAADNVRKVADHTRNSGAAALPSPAASPDPTITSVLQSYLLTPAELRSVLDALQTQVAPLMHEVNSKEPTSRKKKPAMCF